MRCTNRNYIHTGRSGSSGAPLLVPEAGQQFLGLLAAEQRSSCRERYSRGTAPLFARVRRELVERSNYLLHPSGSQPEDLSCSAGV